MRDHVNKVDAPATLLMPGRVCCGHVGTGIDLEEAKREEDKVYTKKSGYFKMGYPRRCSEVVDQKRKKNTRNRRNDGDLIELSVEFNECCFLASRQASPAMTRSHGSCRRAADDCGWWWCAVDGWPGTCCLARRTSQAIPSSVWD